MAQNEKKTPIKLGMQVRCIVSGFTGTVISRTEYLNGCVRYGVEPPAKDGKLSEAAWVDEQQLEVVKAVTPATKIVQANTGGPRPRDPGVSAPKGPATPRSASSRPNR